MAIQEIEAKTGLTKNTMAEAFLVSLYRVTAPYRGCAHGCRYCDGRAEKYYVEGDFERDIAVRANLPELVAADVGKGFSAREFGALCIGSGVTDVYQPLEASLQLTRRTLEALVPAGLPIVILTKSDLILRDFDVLAKFPRTLIIVTLTTVDQSVASLLEPGAASVASRLAVLEKAREAGFLTGVMAMPLCPGIGDQPSRTEALFAASADAGAGFVYPGSLTLRPGRQKDKFIGLVDDSFPQLRSLYDDVYRENRPSGMPIMSYAGPLMASWHRRLAEMRMPAMIPHGMYRQLLAPPDALFVLLTHMESLYSMKGVDTRPLRRAAGKYAAWLKAERTALRRKRFPALESDPFPITRILTEKLRDVCGEPDGFSGLCGNERLASLVKEIVLGGCTFDYASLSAVPPVSAI